jgi:predicted YcjX-like family ATPase
MTTSSVHTRAQNIARQYIVKKYYEEYFAKYRELVLAEGGKMRATKEEQIAKLQEQIAKLQEGK